MKKKQSPSWVLLVGAIFFLALAILCVILYSDLMFGTKVSNINKLLQQGTLESNSGSYVEMDIDAVLDNFAETSHKKYGITIGKEQHYLVWLDDDSMIAVSVKGSKNVDAMNEIMEKTWDWVDGKTEDLTDTPLHLKGKIGKMDTELKTYFQQSLNHFGITSADRDIHYYQIDCTDSRLMTMLMTAFFFVLFILFVVLFFAERAKVRRAALADEVAADMGFGYPGEHSAYNRGYSDPYAADDMEYPATEVPVTEAPESGE